MQHQSRGPLFDYEKFFPNKVNIDEQWELMPKIIHFMCKKSHFTSKFEIKSSKNNINL
jgi:hypothetical protein